MSNFFFKPLQLRYTAVIQISKSFSDFKIIFGFHNHFRISKSFSDFTIIFGILFSYLKLFYHLHNQSNQGKFLHTLFWGGGGGNSKTPGLHLYVICVSLWAIARSCEICVWSAPLGVFFFKIISRFQKSFRDFKNHFEISKSNSRF